MGLGDGVVGRLAGAKRNENKEVFYVGFQLRPRDYDILSALELWGILGLGQVQGFFFYAGQDRSRQASLLFNEGYRHKGCAYRRLRKLELAGLLKVHRQVGYAQVYGLRERGYRLLKQRGRACLPSFLRGVSSFTLNHRIMVAAVGLLSKTFLKKSVRTERQVWFGQKAQKRAGEWSGELLVPDLIVSDEQWFGMVEVELHQKSDKRYLELWDHYRRRLPERASLLYLLPTRERMRGLLELAGTRYFPFLYALDLPSFQGSLGRADFLNSGGKAVSLLGRSRSL